MNQIIEVEIEGISALLMHAFPMVPVEALEKKTPEEQAEFAAYRHPDSGELYIPGVAIQRTLIGAATYSKGKGRASLQKVAAASFIVSPDYCLLGTHEYIIDVRRVVIPATKGRVIRYRPRLDSWRTRFNLEFDPDLMKASEVRKIVDDAGSRVGLLDFRPAMKGPFGRFMVATWHLNGRSG